MAKNNNKSDDDTASTHPDEHSLEGADIWGHQDDNKHQEEPSNQDDPMQIDDDELEREARHMTTQEIKQRILLLDNEIRIMRGDCHMIDYETKSQKRKIKENQDRLRLNTQLPLLVSTVCEVLPPEHNDEGM